MSLDSTIMELHKAHQVGQEKYTYFLLAAAGAAIGFAVQKVEGQALSWWLVPVALATLSWGASFFCGCRNLDRVGAALAANKALLELRQGTHPNQPPAGEFTAAAASGVKRALMLHVDAAGAYARWQFRLLIAGAVLFIAWRVAEMVRLTYPQLG